MQKKLPPELILEQMEIGPLQNFLYFVGCQQTKQIAVFDPAWDIPLLDRLIKEKNYKVTQVILTHGHPDHVNGLDEFLSLYDVPVYISEKEHHLFMPKHKNIIRMTDEREYAIGNVTLKSFRAPGHSPGSLCFQHKNILVTGDVIFIDGCGRCDLPGGSPKDMYYSLTGKIMPLADDTLLFTGHNYGPTPVDTLGHQKQTNPYLQANSLEDFLYQRM
ncbi:MAG: MBL fold metallo-hydrolase [Candidatus Omnitrophica bacterium]|nr:MBL fold metallo-hydrolase [Candidatus Omnitrophota bacterium]